MRSATPGASRVASVFLCIRAVATTPAESQGASFALFPCHNSLPRKIGGSASALRLSRPARRSLTLRPAYLPSHRMTLYTGGSSRFVASTAAPIATGWSESCRAGLAPAGKPCLCTAHKIMYAKAWRTSKRPWFPPRCLHVLGRLLKLKIVLICEPPPVHNTLCRDHTPPV